MSDESSDGRSRGAYGAITVIHDALPPKLEPINPALVKHAC